MNKFIFPIIFAVTFASCSSSESTIDGSVTGLYDTKVYLSRYENRTYNIFDSTMMDDGQFSFELSDIYPEQIYISFDGINDRIALILEKGDISVICDFDSIPNFSISGTPSNELLGEYDATMVVNKKSLDSLISELDTYKVMGDTLKIDSMSNIVKLKSENNKEFRNEFLREHNDSYVTAYLLSQSSTYGYTHNQLDSLLSMLKSSMKPNKFKDKLIARRDALERVSIGTLAPDFTMTTSTGEQFTLSSLKGQCVLIDFWASWCGQCRRANPEIVKMYNLYKDRGFTVLGVSLDNDHDKWLNAILADGLTWTHVSELKGWNSSVVSDYAIVGIPHTVLIDSTGVIIANVVFGEELQEKIEQNIKTASKNPETLSNK